MLVDDDFRVVVLRLKGVSCHRETDSSMRQKRVGYCTAVQVDGRTVSGLRLPLIGVHATDLRGGQVREGPSGGPQARVIITVILGSCFCRRPTAGGQPMRSIGQRLRSCRTVP